MKRTFAAFLAMMLLLACTACAPAADAPSGEGTQLSAPEPPQTTLPQEGQMEEEMRLIVTIGGQAFAGTLEDSETARAFAAMLPATLSMRELNGNEKYHYLDAALPAQSTRPGTISAGDLMLFGDNCVVLFYESFPTSYSYTRLGRVEAEGLSEALGGGAVTVTFAIED